MSKPIKFWLQFARSTEMVDNLVKQGQSSVSVVIMVTAHFWLCLALAILSHNLSDYPLYVPPLVFLVAFFGVGTVVFFIRGIYYIIPLAFIYFLMNPIFVMSPDEVAKAIPTFAEYLDLALAAFKYSLPFAGVFFLFLIWFIRHYGKTELENKHRRGVEVMTESEYMAIMPDDGMAVANIKIDRRLIPRNIAACAVGGTGKSVFTRHFINPALEEGYKLLILDPSNKAWDYTGKFYDPSDPRHYICCPLHAESFKIDPLEYVRVQDQVDISIWQKLAQVTIPSTALKGYSSDFWINGARTMLAIVYKKYYEEGATMADFKELFMDGDLHGRLISILHGTPALNYIARRSDQTQGFMTTLVEWLRYWEFLEHNTHTLSINDFLNEPGGGAVFLPALKYQMPILKHVYSIYIELFSAFLMTRKDSEDFKFIIICDELQTWHRLTELVELLQGRSKGIGTLITYHDKPELEEVYGKTLTKHLLNQFGNKIWLSQNTDETAADSSKDIGSAEVDEVDISMLIGWSKFREGENITKKQRLQAAFINSQIQGLRDLEAIVSLKNTALFRWDIPYKSWPETGYNFQVNPEFAVKHPDRPEPGFAELDLDLAF